MTSSGGYTSTSTIPVSWVHTGGFKVGWHALDDAMDTVPAATEGMDLLSTRASINRNIILVTDEDRNKLYQVNTAAAVKQDILDHGYALNAVVNIGIANTNASLGMKIDGSSISSTIYQANAIAAGGYSTYNRGAGEDYQIYITKWDHSRRLYQGREISTGTGGPNGGCTENCETPAPTRHHEISNPGPCNNRHFTTWKSKHFEYHGQCNLTLVKDADFIKGKGLDIQICTNIVRFWSYTSRESVSIKIGNDILEIEGSADADDAKAHYWVNYEYQGELDTFTGFPVSQELPSVYKRHYIIEVNKSASIVVQLYKEFVRVNGGHSVFGNTVGLLGNDKTGQLLARDGSTVMDDFAEFGDEWQVLPSEPRFFHKVAHPQFSELCIKPEDPLGERNRRLAGH
ncbi:unnamed protein product [Cylindrotheca closterium]|uniref:Uncharacterized protein n=1 Tax=Cylindrotheca closterium TaxID=2856 RepID=A0AAD2FIT1_9STRA|nr:unnamed protein product [Cylindrotheca closterium]